MLTGLQGALCLWTYKSDKSIKVFLMIKIITFTIAICLNSEESLAGNDILKYEKGRLLKHL